MPRHRRYFEKGYSVHVIQRGNNRMRIFGDDKDRERFLSLVQKATRKHGVSVHGFVLMDNHTHFIVTPQHAKSLRGAMHAIGGKYARYFNRKYGRIGRLWNNRYTAKIIGDATYWLTCLRYIEQNPVRAHIVETPDEFCWSSYRTHGKGETISWLEPHDVYLRLGATPTARQAAYRATCGIALDETELTLLRRPPLPQELEELDVEPAEPTPPRVKNPAEPANSKHA